MVQEIDKKLKEKADKSIAKDGWIRATALIEALAIDEKTASGALKKHIDKLGKEPQIILYKRDFQKAHKVENPFPNIKEGYSSVVEVEFASKNFEGLVWIAMHYGPTSLEILEPRVLKVDIGEAQGILVSVAEMVHRFVAAGIGGVVVSS